MTQNELIAALDSEIFGIEQRINRIEEKLHDLNKDTLKATADESKEATDLRILLTLQTGCMREFMKILKIRKHYAEGKPIDWTEFYQKGK